MKCHFEREQNSHSAADPRLPARPGLDYRGLDAVTEVAFTAGWVAANIENVLRQFWGRAAGRLELKGSRRFFVPTFALGVWQANTREAYTDAALARRLASDRPPKVAAARDGQRRARDGRSCGDRLKTWTIFRTLL
jgi:hypothetical protein